MERQIIRGNTRLVALLGDPVAHSISPLIHNHAFAVMRLPYAYIPLAVSHDRLGDVLSSLRACSFVGANVTIPHKQSVMQFCDEVSPQARRTGAVNTLYFREGLLCGTSTDADGFLRALDDMNFTLRHAHVVILGNGGVARTLGSILGNKEIASLTMVGRNVERVRTCAEALVEATGFPVSWTLFDRPELGAIMHQASLCINGTSVGMYPHVQDSPLPAHVLHPGLTVFDTIYNPVHTKLLLDAADKGCPVQNGLAMLLYQAIASFSLWTGTTISSNMFNLDELSGAIARHNG